jgi:anti-anti-sigma regulatory factor
MFSLKRSKRTSFIKFELDYTYPTHKNIISDLFNEAIENDDDKIVLDLSNVKILDISSFKMIINGTLRCKHLGKELEIRYNEDPNDNYVSRIFEFMYLDKKGI